MNTPSHTFTLLIFRDGDPEPIKTLNGSLIGLPIVASQAATVYIRPLCPKCAGEMKDGGIELEADGWSRSGSRPRFSCLQKNGPCKFRYNRGSGWSESPYPTAAWRISELTNAHEFQLVHGRATPQSSLTPTTCPTSHAPNAEPQNHSPKSA